MADVSFITDRLATGGAIGGLDVAGILALGITHIVDCQAETDDTHEFAGTNISVLWDGVPDDGNPQTHGPAWFGPGIEFALAALAQPHTKVLCHCAAGINRGPSMAYAVMLALGFNVNDAENLIRAARPQVGLAYKLEAQAAVPALGY
jgi:dual specificity phosphatase 3